jgi:hypothetical protein
MTALARYARLEAIGRWSEDARAPAREVVVAFGDATLTLKDLAERPLGHWALAGVAPVRREAGATVYAMAGGGETLAIDDAEMNAAIAAVAGGPRRRSRDRSRGVAPVIAFAGLILLLGALAVG